MEFKIFIILFLTFCFSYGVYFIYKAFNGWNKNYVPHKLSAQAVREVVGYDGTRVIVGIIGVVFTLIPTLIFANKVLGISFPDRWTSGTNTIFITVEPDKSIDSDIYSLPGELAVEMQSLNDHIKYSPQARKDEYVKISFRNNYLNYLPLIIFDLQNLKEIDLTNNDIESLPIEKIKSLKKLRKLILTNTSISPENLKQLKQLHYIKVIM